MKLQCPIPRILLPIDGSEHSKRAVQFAGCLGASVGKSLSGITLLHVTGGSYLSPMTSIDLRAEVLKQPDAFEMIRDKHIKERVIPLLEEGEKILRDLGVGVEIGRLLVDGDPGHEIVKLGNEGEFSTIIMARRGLSGIEEFFLGSVTNKVVHTATKQTVYIVGRSVLKEKEGPIPKILISVDGSPYSMKGAEHAACLTGVLKGSITRITLLQVIDLALYLKNLKEGIDPEEEAKKILEEAKAVLVQAGVSEGVITTKVRVGTPADEILKEAEEDHNLVIIGRKGRTAIKDLILGGVSSTVLHRCLNPTVAIMSSK